jgi:hypothetical protein
LFEVRKQGQIIHVRAKKPAKAAKAAKKPARAPQ